MIEKKTGYQKAGFFISVAYLFTLTSSKNTRLFI
jgi:hypothetical protein